MIIKQCYFPTTCRVNNMLLRLERKSILTTNSVSKSIWSGYCCLCCIGRAVYAVPCSVSCSVCTMRSVPCASLTSAVSIWPSRSTFWLVSISYFSTAASRLWPSCRLLPFSSVDAVISRDTCPPEQRHSTPGHYRASQI